MTYRYQREFFSSIYRVRILLPAQEYARRSLHIGRIHLTRKRLGCLPVDLTVWFLPR